MLTSVVPRCLPGGMSKHMSWGITRIFRTCPKSDERIGTGAYFAIKLIGLNAAVGHTRSGNVSPISRLLAVIADDTTDLADTSSAALHPDGDHSALR